jgi:anthranilate synthase
LFFFFFFSQCDHEEGEYANLVTKAKEKFRLGELFEVVPGQVFSLKCHSAPSRLFALLKTRNPSPYGFLFNLGGGEWLVGASPEMYVRCERDGRVETCPIRYSDFNGHVVLLLLVF